MAGVQRSRCYCSVSHRPWLFLLNDLYGIKNILFMLIMFLYINWITLFHCLLCLPCVWIKWFLILSYLWRFLTHQMISDVQVVSSVDPTLPLIHCKRPSYRSCQRLSVAPQPSFPTIQTFELVYISVVFCMHLCKLGQRIWCFLSATLFGGLGPF